ncbi:hypothetical protein VN97_g2771 [Penicillium thymicola]|uniref:Uncharacterized protein n=1 Tax=Penicillium thymicola TaxID=293382 RepID=A0AAI9TNE6_PENTH|nr:hypothetical protein VN97_g2771 [Penicillium thymicola]
MNSFVASHSFALFHPKADVTNEPPGGTYFHAVLNKETWVLILINLHDLLYKDSPTLKLAAKRSTNFLQIQFRFNLDAIQIQFRFSSDSVQIQFRFTLEIPIPTYSRGDQFYIVVIQTSLSIGRLQLITTTLVDLNYCWQYEPMTELCVGGILSHP